MGHFTIDQEKCKRDGICAAECPARIIQINSPKDYPTPTADFERYCIVCGHCVTVCPSGAFSLDRLGPEDCPPIRQELSLSAAQAEQFLRSRRSVRSYLDRSVERDKLEKLLEIASLAPSARNMQPWHWLVIEDSNELRRLAGLVIEWMCAFIEQDPELAGNLGFPRVVASWEAGEDRICRGAPHLIVAHADKDWRYGPEDCALALSHLDLFAPCLGLGTCWAGFFYTAANAYPPLFMALGAPSEHKVYGAMMIGYPRFKYHRLPLRKPPRVTWK
jgi:nitroreductase/NAD-dependent dihydropyrimidine dehydrogenase PreA subunit